MPLRRSAPRVAASSLCLLAMALASFLALHPRAAPSSRFPPTRAPRPAPPSSRAVPSSASPRRCLPATPQHLVYRRRGFSIKFGYSTRICTTTRSRRVRLLTGPVKFIYVRARLHIRDASSTSTEDTNVYEPCTTNIAKDRRVPLRWPSTPSLRPMPEQAPLAWIASSTSTDDPEHLRSLHDCEM